MGLPVMDRGFRRIKKAPVVAEPIDPRLALVDLFKGSEVFRPDGTVDLAAPLPEGVVDLSGDTQDFSALFIEDAQEPAEQPVADETENLAVEAPEAADEAQVQPEPVSEPEPRVQMQDEKDYDPIAAVLG